MKQGYLKKIGSISDLIKDRFYVLKYHTLFTYKSSECRHPTQILPLIGVRVKLLPPERNFNRLGIFRNHDDDYPLKILLHESRQVINEWIIELRKQARSFALEDKYQKIVIIGQGFFSHVVTCRNRLTQEIVAVKIISKLDMTEQ